MLNTLNIYFGPPAPLSMIERDMWETLPAVSSSTPETASRTLAKSASFTFHLH